MCNLPPLPSIFPDYAAPVVHVREGERTLSMYRWGMPSSKKALYDATAKRADKVRAKGKPVDFDMLLRMEPDGGTTNIRNTASKHWTRWLGPESRAGIDLPYPITQILFHDQTEETDGDRSRQREGWPAGSDPPRSRFAVWQEEAAAAQASNAPEANS